MARIPPEGIAFIAQRSGFEGDNIAIATAIALAESNGNPNAHNPVPPDNSYGLWQINMIGDLGPSRRRAYGLNSNEDLFNPYTNGRVAYRIYQSSGFRAWSTYTSGTYRIHMGRARNAARNPKPVTSAGVPTEELPLSGNQALAQIFQFVTNSENWLRVAMFLGGGVLLIMAIVAFGSQSKLANTVASAIPAGKALKAVKRG